MLLEFATKRDRNGNRYYLGVDTENKTFSRQCSHWYCREDIVEIGKRDRNKIIEQLETANYKEIIHIGG